VPAAGTSVTTTGLTSFQVANAGAVPPTVQPFTVCAQIFGFVCAVPTTTTVTVTATGPSSTFVNPFGLGVYFYLIDGNGVNVLFGTNNAPVVTDNGVTRRWIWTATLDGKLYAADPGAVPNAVPLFAIGVRASGDALKTVTDATMLNASR
jgi:hypothetical protein